jgi:hypothetical protein
VRYPNLRYGDPNLFIHYASWYPRDQRVKILSRQLRRGESTIRAWLSGEVKVPWWTTEMMRLQKMEHDEMLRQMNMQPVRARLGLVTADVIEFRKSAPLDDGLVDRVNHATDKFLVLAG